MIDGDLVVHELELRASPDAVFRLFTTAAGLERWLGMAADVDPRPGGHFRFEVAPGQSCIGEYLEVAPPRRVVLTWGWSDPAMEVPPGSSIVTVDLVPHGVGTRLRLVHSGLPTGVRPLHDDGWTRFVGRLAAHAAGSDPGVYPTGDPAARRAELDAGTGRR